MKPFSTLLTSFAVIMLLAIVSACANDTPTPGNTSTNNTSEYSSPTSASNTTNPYGTGTTPTSAAASTGSTGAEINTTTATVNGQKESVLTTNKGMTLYYYKPDTATNVACTGGCASTWPPYLSTSKQTPTSATSLPGKLSILNGANGAQITYNGHPLYTYAGDTSAGQTNGEGLGGNWYVVATNVAQLS